MDKGGKTRKRLRANARVLKRSLDKPGRKHSFKIKPKPGTDGVEESEIEVSVQMPDGKLSSAKVVVKNDP
jgi:hypothetical protein